MCMIMGRIKEEQLELSALELEKTLRLTLFTHSHLQIVTNQHHFIFVKMYDHKIMDEFHYGSNLVTMRYQISLMKCLMVLSALE